MPKGENSSSAVTGGVRIAVRSRYVPEQSSPRARRYVFEYTVDIRNEGTDTVQLKTRHWVITNSEGKVVEVRGDGVVGEQPVLVPGGQFQYTSGAVLETSSGEMHGSYQMVRQNGQTFDAMIAPFVLGLPYSLN